jgi:hypothetical protein
MLINALANHDTNDVTVTDIIYKESEKVNEKYKKL